jgi:hypothetical protein
MPKIETKYKNDDNVFLFNKKTNLFYRGAKFWRWTKSWRQAAVLNVGFWQNAAFEFNPLRTMIKNNPEHFEFQTLNDLSSEELGRGW